MTVSLACAIAVGCGGGPSTELKDRCMIDRAIQHPYRKLFDPFEVDQPAHVWVSHLLPVCVSPSLSLSLSLNLKSARSLKPELSSKCDLESAIN